MTTDLLAPASRPRVMGILNVTPDSFSDGGRHATAAAAIEHGLAMAADGADIIDVGGESTRPGATRPTLEQELDRVLPVVQALSAAGLVVSIDTMRAEVVRATVAAGAAIVNDVSGGLADPDLLPAVAEAGCVLVCMHWRAHADRMAHHADYGHRVVEVVADELGRRARACRDAGIDRDRLVLDPGLGFAKDPEHNWELLGGLDVLAALGQPLLIGASRKSFLGALLASADGQPRPVDQREAAHSALCALLAERGVWGVRVHDVRATRDALAVVGRLGVSGGR